MYEYVGGGEEEEEKVTVGLLKQTKQVWIILDREGVGWIVRRLA